MAAAQSFIRGQQRTVSTADITSDAFTFLNMSGEKNTTLNPNLPFVQLYQIIENNGRIHHLVIQKNKELQLTAFGIENGLMPFFTCKEKWLLPIGACIQQNHSVAFGEIDEAVYVACIVDRLNRCR